MIVTNYKTEGAMNDITAIRDKVLTPVDYIISAGCGAATGLVDIFAVGSSKSSPLKKVTFETADKMVERFAKANVRLSRKK